MTVIRYAKLLRQKISPPPPPILAKILYLLCSIGVQILAVESRLVQYSIIELFWVFVYWSPWTVTMPVDVEECQEWGDSCLGYVLPWDDPTGQSTGGVTASTLEIAIWWKPFVRQRIVWLPVTDSLKTWRDSTQRWQTLGGDTVVLGLRAYQACISSLSNRYILSLKIRESYVVRPQTPHRMHSDSRRGGHSSAFLGEIIRGYGCLALVILPDPLGVWVLRRRKKK